MKALFSSPKTPTPPKMQPKRRMPTEASAEVSAAVERRRKAAAARKGARATILTDDLEGVANVNGSSGQKLGG